MCRTINAHELKAGVGTDLVEHSRQLLAVLAIAEEDNLQTPHQPSCQHAACVLSVCVIDSSTLFHLMAMNKHGLGAHSDNDA